MSVSAKSTKASRREKGFFGGGGTLQPTSLEWRLIHLLESLLVLHYQVKLYKTLIDHLLLPNVMEKRLIQTKDPDRLHQD